MSADSEIELIRKLRKGDPAAFHQLVDGFGKRLFGLAHSLLGNAQDAEDVVQETLTGAYRSIGGFKEKAALWTWLVRILVRQVARSRRSLSARSQKLKIGSPIDELEDEGFLQATSSGATARSDSKIDIVAAIGKLPADQREMIVLREFEQMSYDEISQALNIPLGTVESRLYRARVELRRLLASYA